MKKFIFALLVIVTIPLCNAAYSDTSVNEKVHAIAYVNSNNFYLNGNSQTQSIAPFIDDESGCMMLPVEWIKQIAGFEYEEKTKNNGVRLRRRNFWVTIEPQSDIMIAEEVRRYYKEIMLNDDDTEEPEPEYTYDMDSSNSRDWGKGFWLGCKAKNINGFLYIPARNILEILGYTVEWVEEEQRINIYEPDFSKLIEVDMFLDSKVNYESNISMYCNTSYSINNNSYLPIVKRNTALEYEASIYTLDGELITNNKSGYATVNSQTTIDAHSKYNSDGGFPSYSANMYQSGYLPEGEYYMTVKFLTRLDYAGVAVEIPEKRIYFKAPKSSTYYATAVRVKMKEGHVFPEIQDCINTIKHRCYSEKELYNSEYDDAEVTYILFDNFEDMKKAISVIKSMPNAEFVEPINYRMM